MTFNNPNLDLVNINAYAKFGQTPSILSQDIEWKRNSESGNDAQPENSLPPSPHTSYAVGIINSDQLNAQCFHVNRFNGLPDI